MICAASSSNPDGELLLAVNGADERLQAAIGRATTDGAVLLAAEEWTVPGSAVRFLAPGVARMLAGLGLESGQLARIACVVGPGSFTGLRMSLAFCEGLAAATGARLAGLGHLELLAREAAGVAQGAVLALSWSRRGQVYAQGFAAVGAARTGGTALTQPLVLTLAELPAFLATLPRPLALLGGGLRRNLAFFAELAQSDAGLHLLSPAWDAPRPAALLELAAGAHSGAGPLAPVYLRASDAEENLAAIAAGRGLSEGAARSILERGSRLI